MIQASTNPHPQTLLAQIREGQIPAEWRVIKSKVSPLKRGLFALLIYLSIAACILWVLFHVLSGEFWLPYAIFSIGISLYLAYLVRREAEVARDTLLVLTPESFLHFCDISKPSVCSYTVYFYTDILSIDIERPFLRYRRSRFWLRMQFENNKSVTWPCPSWYGPSLQIARDIIVAHTRYMTLRANKYLPESAYMLPHQ